MSTSSDVAEAPVHEAPAAEQRAARAGTRRAGCRRRAQELADRAAFWWREHDSIVYAVFAVACTLYAASAFYAYMLVQTRGVWSAPLDDVFIHFDYARSFARGYPFQWSEGNGYSSGNTSLSYPIVLALGYWIGFRELQLMVWAAMVAVVSVAAFLVCAGRLAVEPAEGSAGRWVRFVVPPAVLSMGALDWTLFSGMENAVHLAVWGLCLVLTLRQARARDRRTALRRAWLAGIGGALLVATRPESAVCVAAFGFYAAWSHRRDMVIRGLGGLARVLIAAGLPAVLTLLAQAAANRLLTGEWSQNGAIAKLFIHNPFMSRGDMWERYLSLLGYIVPRLTHHHFSAIKPLGWMIPAIALVPLGSRRFRPLAILLWSQILGWLAVVALNNQLRWHNERYAMPAVAWLLILAALGLGVLVQRARPSTRPTLVATSMPYRFAAALGLVVLYWIGQAPRFQDQVWFFGRASRNILDQHVTAGRLLKEMNPSRVLVGDAGALVYVSDRPGLDLIGLGGYHAFPFARSTVHGLGSSIELIERMPERDRPDVMAIYPSWWGDLPTYFGEHVASVPVRGNVICGGPEKVIYRAHWRSLDRQGVPRSLRKGEQIVDELDVADLVSEQHHGYDFPQPHVGFVRYRVLGDPDAPQNDLFDAGRIVPNGYVERAQMLAPPAGGGRLILRVAPEHAMRTRVRADGREVGELHAEPRTGIWQELSLRLPPTLRGRFQLELEAQGPETVHYHVWVVEAAP